MTKPIRYSDKLTATWGERVEGVEQITARVQRMLHGLAGLDPRFEKMYHFEGGRFKDRPLPRHDLGLLQEFVAKGRNREDDPPYRPIERLGYEMGGWNKGHGPTAISWGWTAGLLPPLLFPNVATIGWDYRSDLSANLPLVMRLVGVMADAWEPDSIGVSPCHEPKGKFSWLRWNTFVPTVGWMIYLAGRRVEKSEVPSAFHVEECGTGRGDGLAGTLVVVREKQVDFGVKGDLALAERVREELGLPLPFRFEKPEKTER